MNWLAVAQYLLARTREPTIVHRAVQAVGGLIAAWALTGPERWIGLILSTSALIGILMPDAVETAHAATPPAALPPIELQARPEPLDTGGHSTDSVGAPAGQSDQLRQSMPSGDQFRTYSTTAPNTYPRFGSGFGDRD